MPYHNSNLLTVIVNVCTPQAINNSAPTHNLISHNTPRSSLTLPEQAANTKHLSH